MPVALGGGGWMGYKWDWRRISPVSGLAFFTQEDATGQHATKEPEQKLLHECGQLTSFLYNKEHTTQPMMSNK